MVVGFFGLLELLQVALDVKLHALLVLPILALIAGQSGSFFLAVEIVVFDALLALFLGILCLL